MPHKDTNNPSCMGSALLFKLSLSSNSRKNRRVEKRLTSIVNLHGQVEVFASKKFIKLLEKD